MIRSERARDVEAIRAVHIASFPTSVEAKLVDVLREAGRLRISLIAEEDGVVVAHVAFSPVTLHGASDGVGLGPVSVLPAFRKRGIAAAIIREGLLRCKQLHFGFVVVLGDPSYYNRFGFLSAVRFGLSDEYGGGDAFQALELTPGSIPISGGLVRYSPEFALVE